MGVTPAELEASSAKMLAEWTKVQNLQQKVADGVIAATPALTAALAAAAAKFSNVDKVVNAVWHETPQGHAATHTTASSYVAPFAAALAPRTVANDPELRLMAQNQAAELALRAREAEHAFELKRARLAAQAKIDAAQAAAARAAAAAAREQSLERAASLRARKLAQDRMRAVARRRAVELAKVTAKAAERAAKKLAARRFAAHMRMLKDAQHKAAADIAGQSMQAKIEAIQAQRRAIETAYAHRIDQTRDHIRTVLKSTVEKARLDQTRRILKHQQKAARVRFELQDAAARANERVVAAYNRQQVAPAAYSFIEQQTQKEADEEEDN